MYAKNSGPEERGQVATSGASRARCADRVVRVGLAGNPNAGKTSLFNALTGSRQRVANYPGVTVERRTARYDEGGATYELVDLPGTYSLSSMSPEEQIAQAELLQGQLDVVVVVVDATTLERSLVLMAQLMLFDLRLVLCLNMSDEAKQSGQELDVELLERLLGLPVSETVGNRGVGIAELRQAIARALGDAGHHSRLVLGERLDRALSAIADPLTAEVSRHRRFWASRLLVGDGLAERALAGIAPTAARSARERAREQRALLESEVGGDAALYLTERLFGFVDGLLREVTRRRARADARATSDLVDNLLAHPWLGLPFFFAAMYATFWIAFTVGEIPMGWLEALFSALSQRLDALWPATSISPLRSLVIDGLIGGVGGVVAFLPNVVLLFACIAVLEDTGYLSRAAFLIDRLMHRFGLHGKSFLPLVTGFGCSIPGIMATRTLEHERDRLATMAVLPLMSCGARLPIWMVLIPAFIPPGWRAFALWSIYFAGIVLALLLVLLLRRTVLRGEDAPFVMELPPYRLPTLAALFNRVHERAWIYLRKAGTVIFAISLLMWLSSSYPQKPHYEVDAALARGDLVVSEHPASARHLSTHELARRRATEALSYSIAGRFGRLLEPLVRPLGFDWKISTALLGAFAAKEVFVSQLGIVYSLDASANGAGGLSEKLRRDYPPLVGLSLMLFLLIATPCMATLAVTRRESGSWKWAALQFVGLSAVAYLVCLVVYQGGRLVLGAPAELRLDVVLAASLVGLAALFLLRRLASRSRMGQLPASCPTSFSGCAGCGLPGLSCGPRADGTAPSISKGANP